MNVFFGDLRIPANEQVGPKLNSRTVNLLHPDMCQTDQDLGRQRIAQRQVDRSTWLPDNHNTNLIVKSAEQVESDGTLGIKNMYVQQKVGPGEPLAPVAPKFDDDIVTVITDDAQANYLEGYAQTPLHPADPEKPLMELFP